jgi:hypothetical protein
VPSWRRPPVAGTSAFLLKVQHTFKKSRETRHSQQFPQIIEQCRDLITNEKGYHVEGGASALLKR